MRAQLIQMIKQNPKIAAINNNKDLESVIEANNKVIFVLYGTINTISDIVNTLKEAGKIVIINVDFIEGLSSREVSVDFICETTQADGIISSKAKLVKAASLKNTLALQRVFVTDSKSFRTIPKQLKNSQADIVDVQPGAAPKVLKWVQESVDVPIIASGLVCEEEDIQNALEAGAIGVSSTNRVIWY